MKMKNSLKLIKIQEMGILKMKIKNNYRKKMKN